MFADSDRASFKSASRIRIQEELAFGQWEIVFSIGRLETSREVGHQATVAVFSNDIEHSLILVHAWTTVNFSELIQHFHRAVFFNNRYQYVSTSLQMTIEI